MKKLLIIVTALFFVSFGLHAQYNISQDKIWVFGYHGLLNFSSGSPSAGISQIDGGSGSSGFLNGCASVSNAGGSLLFYCSADSVWDKFGTVMPNGSDLLPNGASPGTDFTGFGTKQGALIVPVIGGSNQYYVFSLQTQVSSDVNSGKLFYCKVDMTLNGGLGDVVAGAKGIKIDSQLSSMMIAIPGNANDIWVMVHALNSGIFKAFHVTSTGINITPVVSSVGGPTGSYTTAVMKSSPDRARIAVCNQGGGPSVQFADFNPSTGVVSNLSSASTTGGFPGGDFSPDNSKFYAFNKGTNTIDQFNLSLSPMSLVFAAETPIGSNLNLYWPDMRLGPDGKIYVPVDGNHLDYISNPNAAGTSCSYTGGASVVSVIGSIKFSLGNVYVTPLSPVAPITGTTMACVGATTTLSCTTTGGVWSSTNTAVAGVGSLTGIVTGVSAGTTIISYTVGASGAAVVVTVNPIPAPISGPSSIACVGATIVLSSSTTGGTWSSSNIAVSTVGSTSGIVTGIASGTSVISYIVSGCRITKNVTVNPSSLSITGSTSICIGATSVLSCSTAGGAWSSSNAPVATIGSTTGIVAGITAGTSIISYTLSTGCRATKNVSVTTTPVVAPISGLPKACVGTTTILTDPTPGGTWSTANSAIAIVNIASGVVTGIANGNVIITYSIGTACGTGIATRIVSILPSGLCSTSVGSMNNNSDFEGIKLFPNPSNGTFSINVVNEEDEPVSINISNITSGIVKEFTAKTNNVIVVNMILPSGIYFVSATTSHFRKISKLIIE